MVINCTAPLMQHVASRFSASSNSRWTPSRYCSPSTRIISGRRGTVEAVSVTQAIGTDFRSQPRPDQWNPYRGPRPLDDKPARSQAEGGGRRKVVIATPVPPPAAERAWHNDKRLQSRWVLVKDAEGKEFEPLFTIGALAQALGKSTVTIRRWIRAGVLPETKLKTAPIEGTPGNSRRRLWTKEQIEALLVIGTETNVVGRKQPGPLSERRFRENIKALWAEKAW